MMLDSDPDWVVCAPYVEISAAQAEDTYDSSLGLASNLIDKALSAEDPLAELLLLAKGLRDLAFFLEDTPEQAENFVYASDVVLERVASDLARGRLTAG